MRSVRNISQVTRALEAVSASKVRRAQQRCWPRAPTPAAFQVLQHLGLQPGSAGSLHLLLAQRAEIRIDHGRAITTTMTCGAYNTNMVRAAMDCAAFERAR
jgi:F-type H+-transporting ATPase subunit gamma